jgi:hypothetical protein
LVRLDGELVDGIVDLDPATQRAVAVWAARRACAAAGLTDLDWVKLALAGLERGGSLPFADLGEAFRLLSADPHVRRTTVASYDGRHEHLSQQHMAVPALWSAAADDPLCGRAGVPVPCDGHGSGSTTGASCPRCATHSPSWRNVILAVAGVVLKSNSTFYGVDARPATERRRRTYACRQRPQITPRTGRAVAGSRGHGPEQNHAVLGRPSTVGITSGWASTMVRSGTLLSCEDAVQGVHTADGFPPGEWVRWITANCDDSLRFV